MRLPDTTRKGNDMITTNMIESATRRQFEVANRWEEPAIRRAASLVCGQPIGSLEELSDYAEALAYDDLPRRNPTDSDQYFQGCVESHLCGTREDLAERILLACE